MTEQKYRYRINGLKLKTGEPFSPGKINVFVGANNCGKTQLLKDILAYIVGSREKRILLDALDIVYPKTPSELIDEYNIKVVGNTNGSYQIRHISPDLSKKVMGPMANDMEDSLKRWLEIEDKLKFREAIGPSMVTYLNTDNRLQLAKGQSVSDLQVEGEKNILESLYLAGSSAVETVREKVKETFETDIYLDTSTLGKIQYRIGADFSNIPDKGIDAYPIVNPYPVLDNQGDGLRSFLGITSALIALKKPIILLDEPEAFLHPPQAMRLGEIIAELIDDSKQIFIATHSADFLRGLLSVERDAQIIHLERPLNDETEARILDKETLNQIITDPLLSSSRVLEGMFYKGIVATEADADAVFYQRLYQKIGASDEIHFLNVHNKQTLKKIIEPYQKLGIKFAMIADADVLRNSHELNGIIEKVADESLKNVIAEERKKILAYFEKKSKQEILDALYIETRKLVEKERPKDDASDIEWEAAIFDFRLALKKLREDSDELAELKQKGRDALPSVERRIFDSFCEHCASVGLFVVWTGELESWLIDYGVDRKMKKNKWISNALETVYDLEVDDKKAVWKFIKDIKQYFSS